MARTPAGPLSLGTSFPHQRWPGNHNAPHSVAIDGNVLYTTAIGAEVCPMIVKMTLNGNIMWVHHVYEGRWLLKNITYWFSVNWTIPSPE